MSIPTGYNHISHSLNNWINAQFGYFFRKSSLSIHNISAEARAEAHAEARAESRAEAHAESRAESHAEAHAESRAESHAEAHAESRAEAHAESHAESRAESRAESQSFSDVRIRYLIDAFTQKHSSVNLACFSTSSFFSSLFGLNQGTFWRLSMKVLTRSCTSCGSGLPLLSLNIDI